MGLFMDADGIPMAFDIFPGNQNEQTTLKPLESKILQDFGCSEFIFCSDAGLGSAANRRFNSLGNRAYVTTHSLKKMKKKDRDIALSLHSFGNWDTALLLICALWMKPMKKYLIPSITKRFLLLQAVWMRLLSLPIRRSTKLIRERSVPGRLKGHKRSLHPLTENEKGKIRMILCVL